MAFLSNLKDNIINNWSLFLSVICLLVFTSIDYVLYVNWIDSMKNYNWYAGSFIFPLVGCLFFWLPTWYQMYVRNYQFTGEREIPQKNLFYIGALDSLNTIAGTLATPFLTIVTMTITDKLVLPLTMIASYYVLGRRYTKTHYLGVFLTIYGIMEAFVPDFTGHRDNNLLWLFIYIIGILPGVASYCCKEIFLKDRDYNYNIWWLNSWISTWQLLFGFITFPVMFIPLPPPIGNQISVNEIPQYFINATKCQFGGLNSQEGDNCRYSLILFFFYQIINTLINILMFQIIRKGSSVIFIIVNALKTPITSWLGSIPQLAGKHTQPISVADLFSFIIIFVGTIVYNHKEEMDVNKPIIDIDKPLINHEIDDEDDSDIL